MTEHWQGITDRWGRPIEKAVLTEEVAAPTIGGVRSPLTGYPGDGLDPARLAIILKEADRGDPLRYLELAETIEERDLHYLGVLGTRKRSVAQLEITVEPGGDSAAEIEQAGMVEDWLKRDELSDELFDILDAIGKGYSFTEIVWDTSEGQWRPGRLEWRDPRWFRPARADLATPMLIGNSGQDEPLPAFKFIAAAVKAKSGLPVRSGLARIVAWAYLFKKYTERDWAIFTQNYGLPIRLGKYPAGTTADDRAKLMRAVSAIAGDMAAVVPASMMLEFVESKSAGTAHANYRERTNWLDQQVSKAVLGQTATTDAIAGGHAVGQEHRQVQEDIERADARALAGILNRDLIRPWVMLEHGPQKTYPRIRIGRAEEADVQMTVESVVKLVPLGLKVGKRQIGALIGLAEPEEDDELLEAPAPQPPVVAPPREKNDPELKEPELKVELQAASTLPRKLAADPLELIAEEAAKQAAPAVATMLAAVKAIVDSASSFEEMRAMLEAAAAAGDIAPADLNQVTRQALLAAELTGRAEINV